MRTAMRWIQMQRRTDLLERPMADIPSPAASSGATLARTARQRSISACQSTVAACALDAVSAETAKAKQIVRIIRIPLIGVQYRADVFLTRSSTCEMKHT
ncbi:hypothetical protein JQ621_07965 [Bradyrhizobium manausense]|uniref:hypothetical protein n=1 Tax=Bradyrhizobium manausense TaxID=989370 RepID=UPI001BAC0CC1|nr:hypothetical protein [Bradyrhizobium manausense]MBR1087417.1 hypothetical protein [Bradyrhizobium manausense]